MRSSSFPAARGAAALPADAAEPAAEARPREILARVGPYLWPRDRPGFRLRVVLAVLSMALAKLVGVATPLFYKGAVDRLSGEGVPMLALGAVGLTVAYGMARLMTVGFQQLRDVIFVRVGQQALREVAVETFTHIHRMSLRYHITRKTGGLSRVMERGVKGIEFLLRFMLFSIGPLVLELVLICAVLVTLFDIWYLVAVAVTLAAYMAFTFRVTQWRLGLRREMNAQDQDANQKAIDSLLNFETVKYFGAEAREAARYDRAMEGYITAAVKSSYSLSALNFGQSFLITAGLVAVMVMAAVGVERATLTVGDFVMVNAYMIQVIQPLNFLGSVYRDIRQSFVDMGAMFHMLDQPPEVADKPGAPALKVPRGEVRFEAVEFGYEAARPILHGLSFAAAPGETVALVGPSGAGKSTIGRLLFRFYDVTGGRVAIDGQDVRDVTQDSLHAQIGVVPQDTVLFNDTLLYNIAYGRPEATRAEIEAAAEAAQLGSFIAALPQGYQTQVGERGLRLSGGEKQRVGIARTILKNPPIVLLDEATSALDTQTERDIQGALKAMGKGRTVLTIAHRLSTVVDADRILVLEAGRVVEQGRHAELLAAGGRYAALWAAQADAAG
ncbi:ABC transporter ATP-binding protein/permease [Mangrovicoccus sp. HB161399]|uniref:ABCB family ABC transporter ATP-binding protein/permease n=1 Tax=Mangrovicoccus sp. HB161399 TaxID=2720392 RepID=UPI0020A691C4|nr:ABC transporter ATP-binding protein/permease [Mangrovicoccus sp. HB161399]